MGKIADFIERRYSLSDVQKNIFKDIFGRPSMTGVNVSESSALKASAVYACVSLLAQTVASLPFPLYQRLPRGKERAINHYLYELLHDTPNPEMDSFHLRETMQGHLATWGNAYADIEWNERSGKINALWPLRPDKMRVVRENGKIFYIYTPPDGVDQKLPAFRIWHIPGFGFNGLVGYSPIRLAREAIGLSLGTEEFGARYFGQGAHMGMVVQHPKALSKQGHENLEKSLNAQYAGLGKAQRLMVLEEGMTWQKIGIPPEDAQFLETRKFQLEEIARFYHIPPHMVGDLDRATFSNIEQQSIEFVTICIRPWLVRWEQSVHLQLMGPVERKQYFAEFLIDGLLRGDSDARGKFYNQMFMIGALSPNDIREKENMNPIDGGDKTFVPLNMVPMDQAEQVIEEKSQRSLPEFRGKKQGAILRARTAKSFEPVFKDFAQRIAKRETDNVRRSAKKYLGERSDADFKQWITDFYRDFPEYIKRQVEPAFQALLEAIVPLAKEEVNFDGDITSEIQKFVEGYGKGFVARYSSSSQGQLEALIDESMRKEEEPLPIIEQRLDEWEEKRAGKVSSEETVHLANEIAKAVWITAGIVRLIWVALGSKSCPLCQEMDGKVVGIEEPFLAKDSVLEAEGTNDFKSYHPTMTPPLHQGCVCSIMPG